MSSYVKLVFATDEGKDYTLTVPDCKSILNAATVNEAMDLIREAGIVGNGTYRLSKNRVAYLYKVETRTFDLEQA